MRTFPHETRDRQSYFHLCNGYPHNIEARARIADLITWYHGGAPAKDDVEKILNVLAKGIQP